MQGLNKLTESMYDGKNNVHVEKMDTLLIT